ncbi:hypothetical protein LJR143_001651 [Pseudoxanthomonas sp. LjRoot143]|uniref:hypothetical protein n=1 Tax=Pseudoxanthomonas sp. LjRoot143 TaxID=3342266 RepID=UPI003ECF1CC3
MGNATIADLARRAVPFLRDEASKYEDDGSNEPLELAREIEAAIAHSASEPQRHPDALPDGSLSKSTSKRLEAVTPRVSEVTRQLIARDQRGREKYGATLDRTDLPLSDWLQHMAEELMDAAGYALAAKRTAQAEANSETAGLRQLSEILSTPDGYEVVEELPGIWGFMFTSDGVKMASGTSWNHPALAAMAAWQNYCASSGRIPNA